MKTLSLIIYALKKGRMIDLEKGQYLFALLFFVVGIILLQAAFDAITLCLALVVLFSVLLIDSQVAVGIGYGFLASIAFYLA
jgi:hypothetical protein